MSEYVDVDIIENGKVIGTTKILKKTDEPEEQKIKLEKVDDKAAYENLLVKYAELVKENAELEQQIEKMKCCANCKSFKGYGETCEGWGEPVLNLNCDCTEWELRR